MKTSSWFLAAALAVTLSACGGGGGGGGDDTAGGSGPAVPASASRSMAGLMSYLGDLVRSKPDSAEPLDLTGFRPPKSEDADAQDLN